MTVVALALPGDVARVLFRHLNDEDEGWRAEIADRLVRADGRDARSKEHATALRQVAIALGILSGRLAGAGVA